METNYPFERYGNLVKEESLVSMDNKILPNTYLLEAYEPFPGFYNYYSEQPLDQKPLYVYFILKSTYTLEEVTRATQKIKVFFPAKNLDVAAGTIHILNETYHMLRIRHLENYDQIANLQACFADEGFLFTRKPSRKINAKGIIRIKKFYVLQPLADGIFIDLIEKNHGYIVLPRSFTWKLFEEISRQVKLNLNHMEYDAALAHFHNNYKIVDMVRIYNSNVGLDFLKVIRDKYLTIINQTIL